MSIVKNNKNYGVKVTIDDDYTLTDLNATSNGTYTHTGYDGYDSVTVNVPAPTISLQDKSITSNGTYTADSGYDGLGTVTVNVSGGSSDSYIDAYYLVNTDVFVNMPFNGWTYGIINSDTTSVVKEMYIDGVLQNEIVTSINWYNTGVHIVRIVFNEDTNYIPDNMFSESYSYCCYIDFSHFTGSTIGSSENSKNFGLKVHPSVTSLGFIGSPWLSSYAPNYIPDTVSLLPSKVNNECGAVYISDDNNYYANTINGATYYSKTDPTVCYVAMANALVPEGITTAGGWDYMKRETYCITFPSSLTNFKGFGEWNRNVCFRGTTVPTLTPNEGMAYIESGIFVPSESVDLYKDAFNADSWWSSLADSIYPVSVIDFQLVYNEGDTYISLYKDADLDVSGLYAIELYNTNDNLVFEINPDTTTLLLHPSIISATAGTTYRGRLWCDNHINRGYLNSLFNQANSVTTVDFSDLQGNTFGNNVCMNMANLQEVTVPSTITAIGSYFCYGTPELTRATILSTTPPTLGENCFYSDSRQQPVTVYVPDADTYAADSSWADLVSNGYITLNTI